MSNAVLYSRAQCDIRAPLVTIEIHISRGLPGFTIVGMPETAVRESKDRVRSALINSRFEFPARRITVNLAPADLPKEGGRFDLGIALGILIASEQLRPSGELRTLEVIGELGLRGDLRSIPGVLPAAVQAKQCGRDLLVPAGNAGEAALIRELTVYPAASLLEVCGHLTGVAKLPAYRMPAFEVTHIGSLLDIADVKGQAHAKRAVEIAAAGGHSLLMIGPPGTGKTLLANRLPGLLPPLTEAEALETATVYSVSQQGFDGTTWRQRPLRAPHHTASGVALVGGGSDPRPGEISLAHNGVLFLDELPEFDRRVLEVLREPMESKRIVISRAGRQAGFPAAFQLVAAMNPCPCGHLGDTRRACRCSPEQIRRYRGKISGPLLDRIDMHIELPTPTRELLDTGGPRGPTSAEIRGRVQAARALQLARGVLNADLPLTDIERICAPKPEARKLLAAAVSSLGLSARAYHRILKIARTIADLDGVQTIGADQIAQTIQFRALDRQSSPP